MVKHKSFRRLLYIAAGVFESVLDDVILLKIYKLYSHSHSMNKSNLTRNEKSTKVTPYIKTTINYRTYLGVNICLWEKQTEM